MGRSFIVRSGITSMLQIATPYATDEDIEGSIDNWIKQLSKKYQDKKAKYIRVPKPKEEAKKGDTEDLSKYDMEEIKKALIESGMDEDLLNLLSNSDLIDNYKSMIELSDAEASEETTGEEGSGESSDVGGEEPNIERNSEE